MCAICEHSNRKQIEMDLVNMQVTSERDELEVIAEKYGVDAEEMKVHAMFHTPLISNPTEQDDDAVRDSLVRRLKLREADVLAEVTAEYLQTLKATGRRINKLTGVSDIDVEDEDKQFKLAKLLTKPMVDMYIGLGGEIRQTVKTMAELDRALNGPKDDLSSGLSALASAIRGSDELR